MITKLQQNYRRRNRIIFSFLTMISFFFAANSIAKYNMYKNEIYNEIDQRLKQSALMTNMLLGEDFFDKAINGAAITKEEDLKNIAALSKIAYAMNVDYVYTLIQKEDGIYFTSSSATSEDYKTSNVTYYFDKYEDATLSMKKSFINNQITYEESSDKWGNFRSIYISLKTKNGNRYVIGADIKIDAIEQKLTQIASQYIATFVVFLLIIIIAFIIYTFVLKKELQMIQLVENNLKKSIQNKTLELQELNNTLENRIKTEVEKNIKQEILLHEKSRLAAIGSMISNIVHQWKQPLSYITTTATAIQFRVSLKEKTDLNEFILDEVAQIHNSVDKLTDTLNTFKNFLLAKKETKEIIVQESINVAFIISNPVLKDNNITIKNHADEVEKITITTIAPELSEVLINIINNAKDALVQNNIQDPWIAVDLAKNDTHAIISIEDNAGGIPKNIIDKIFDENFTTKECFEGTGIGLFMSKMIIEESLKGNLFVKNTNHGAKFFIELPLDY